MKKAMKEQRGKRQRKTKKSYSLAKNDLVMGHSFMTSSKTSEFRTPFSIYTETSNFKVKESQLIRQIHVIF